MSTITDPDVRILASCSKTLQGDYAQEESQWRNSPFAWIKARPSRQIGVIGEKLVAGFLATKGFDVVRSPDSQADRIINGKRAEIKFSTLWKSGVYKFQQLRDQDYEFVVCLGISPFNAHCWVIPKVIIMKQWHAGKGLTPQHGGKVGTGTAWLSVTPGQEPQWLQKCGDKLKDAAERITTITGRKPLR